MKHFNILLVFVLLVVGCTKNEDSNTKPKCEILSPLNNSTYDVGDTIVIKVRASDADNNLVPTVSYAINDISYGSVDLVNGECSISLYTSNWYSGPFTFSVSVSDDKGDFTESKIALNLHQINEATVSLVGITDVSAKGVTILGSISATGGTPILSCGFILQQWPNDALITKYCDPSSISENRFTLSVNDLEKYRYYFVRNAFATNKAGTSYSNQQSISFFTAPEEKGVFTDTRDNKEYGWIKIGNQVWMTENLAYLPKVDNRTSLSNMSDESFLVYNYTPDENLDEVSQVANAKSTSNYGKFGVLYSWKVVENNNVCPAGWHIPTYEEWNQMIAYLEGFSTFSADNIGRKLAASSGWEISSYFNEIGYGGGGDNVLGFSAVGGGMATASSFIWGKQIGYYWTPTIDPAQQYYPVKGKGFDYRHAGIDHEYLSKEEAYSIRCIKD